MTISHVTPASKTISFTNGTTEDAKPVDDSFVTLFNNDANIANTVNTMIDQGRFPTSYRESAPPTYATTSTFTVAFIRERDGADTIDITYNSSSTVDITTSGFNGLDTGTVANSTFYYLYAICKGDGSAPGLLLSIVNESVTGSITLPATYTKKRQLPFWILTDSSGNIIPFQVSAGWPYQPTIRYRTTQTIWTGLGFNSSLVEVTPTFSTGSATITNSFIPSICGRTITNFVTSAGSLSVFSITPHSGTDLTYFHFSAAGNQLQEIPNASSFDVTQAVNNSAVHIDFLGGVVTGVQ